MKFTKMHGIGNDYVYVNGFEQRVNDPAEVARKISNRHYGIGADGLILILPSDKADVRMRMFNADGSEAEMCGNGVRCVAKYAFDHGLSRSNPMRVETGRGVLSLELQQRDGRVHQVTVNMGEPILELERIPVNPRWLAPAPSMQPHTYELRFTADTVPGEYKAREIEEDEPPLDVVPVSMGNPHAVTFVSDIESPNLLYQGPLVENHRAFPRRVNAHWVQVMSRGEVIMKTWERGSGITMACGTGACAVCVAGSLTGRTDRTILAHLPGGDLTLDWRERDGCVYMTGPAVEVFSGEWNG
jgi:diaminopimelate epimerase